MIAEIPQTLARYPLILALSFTVYISPTIVIAIGCTAPAPKPCTKRKVINMSIDEAKPLKIDPIRKIITPIINIGFIPNKSDSLPQIIVVTTFINKKEQKTQLYKEKHTK